MCFGRLSKTFNGHQPDEPGAANVERREVRTARAIAAPTNLRSEAVSVELRDDRTSDDESNDYGDLFPADLATGGYVYRREVQPGSAIAPPTNLRSEFVNPLQPDNTQGANVERRKIRSARAITPPAAILSHEIASHIVAESPGRTTGTVTRPSEERRVQLGQTTNANPVLNSIDNEPTPRKTGGLRGWLRKARGK